MRDYEPIWIALKRDKKVSVTTHRGLHRRLIKAVTKEKWLDYGYKLDLLDRKKIPRMRCSINGAIVTFVLRHAWIWEQIQPGDI